MNETLRKKLMDGIISNEKIKGYPGGEIGKRNRCSGLLHYRFESCSGYDSTNV